MFISADVAFVSIDVASRFLSDDDFFCFC